MIDQHTLDYIYKLQDERDWWQWYSMIQGVVSLFWLTMSVRAEIRLKKAKEGAE